MLTGSGPGAQPCGDAPTFPQLGAGAEKGEGQLGDGDQKEAETREGAAQAFPAEGGREG